MENISTFTLVVALALHDGDGHWLMHKRPAHKHHGNLWEFPGGKVEAAETPVNALVREIREELGITIRADDLVPAGFAQEAPGTREAPIVILLYTCTRWEGEVEALEGGEVDWFTADMVPTLSKPPLDVALWAGVQEKSAD